MESTVHLIDLLGAGALIIWGLRLIKTGILRAFGSSLRLWIAKGTGNRFTSALSGLMATLAVQSSTATAVITASFTAREIINPRMAQAVMLGANVGTAIAAVILSFDLHWLSPALILVGVITYSRSKQTRGRGVGRALLGLGLMLLALQLLAGVTDPLRSSEVIATVLQGMSDAPVFALAFAMGLAFLASSSLAVVMLIALMAQSGLIDATLAVVLVGGANLGGAIPPLLAVAREGVAAQRLAVSNLLVRALGALAFVLCAPLIAEGLLMVLTNSSHLTIATHLGFNILLLVVFLPLLGMIAGLAALLVPAAEDAEHDINYLDEGVLETPALALAGAARETLRVGDLVREMLERNLRALEQGDTTASEAIAQLDDAVDARQHGVKLYLAKLKRTELGEEDRKRCSEITSYAINLEHIGDIIDRDLMRMAVKKVQRQVRFSSEGLAEITEMYRKTIVNMQLAQSVFFTRAPELAHQLIAAKVDIRHLEARSAERHLARVEDQRSETLDTSALHLDILRDLKRLNAHLASAAYPILEEIGALRESRVRSPRKSVDLASAQPEKS